VVNDRLARALKGTIFGRSPLGAYMRLNRWIWNNLPSSLTTALPIRSYGNFLHTLVRLSANRGQSFGTFFLRNRPQLELIRRLSNRNGKGSTLRITVLGCSKGAEVYSIVWTIRTARPDLKIILHAVDISKEVLEFAEKGVYSLTTPELVEVPIFECMTPEEMQEMFETEGDRARIKPWIKEGVVWHVGDAGDRELVNVLGPQDIVVANNFLCHMNPRDAERCLRNIAGLANQGGYLLVSGVDLNIRTKVARDLGWQPLHDLIEDIHDGDSYVRTDWPWKYWGLEPLNKRRRDWNVRYASVFQVVAGDSVGKYSATERHSVHETGG
jgi:SAM-dependent methyltransferase